MSDYACRFCNAPLRLTFCDLGMSPLSNAYLRDGQLQAAEKFYPLHSYVCEQCWLVQLPAHETPDHIFGQDYAYFSSYSDSWLAHCKAYCELMVQRFGFGATSQVVEIASNDGYLLQYFKAQGVPVLGIEPAANCAAVAEAKGIASLVRFFGVKTATELRDSGRGADLLLGNNVLAHVPDLNDFVAGLKIALNPRGIVTMEFPHLLQLMTHNQFDTIYHEHYSYLSLLAVRAIFARHGLTLFDVQELPTHGGSLRIYARHSDDESRPVAATVAALLTRESSAGLDRAAAYRTFERQVQDTRYKLLEFLIRAKRDGKRVWGYGAPAKGNTLLNYCGIRADLLEATVDRSPHKQGLYLPGTHIPIHAPARLDEARPDYVLILPWNLKDEIVRQVVHIRDWGGRFVVPIPQVQVLE
jgi:2-polyprenyl-3-methyl-5-hydroxy-6-metoxy-1,4-benzoquinol methylase